MATGELTPKEIDAWLKGTPGSCVASCSICHQITLYMISKRFGMDSPPSTCGRWKCGAKAKEGWAKGYVPGK